MRGLRLVERLLASPHYGERWARHWMDLARYADSGRLRIRSRPSRDAWRYRDYLVNAFNNDKPYDQFMKEQLAGDEYVAGQSATEREMISDWLSAARAVRWRRGERGKQDALDDMITTTSMTFHGLTVGCARCHNHKFDPIPQKDYYRMQAVFYSTRPKSLSARSAGRGRRQYRKRDKRIDRACSGRCAKAKADLEAPYQKRLVDESIAQAARVHAGRVADAARTSARMARASTSSRSRRRSPTTRWRIRSTSR